MSLGKFDTAYDAARQTIGSATRNAIDAVTLNAARNATWDATDDGTQGITRNVTHIQHIITNSTWSILDEVMDELG